MREHVLCACTVGFPLGESGGAKKYLQRIDKSVWVCGGSTVLLVWYAVYNSHGGSSPLPTFFI